MDLERWNQRLFLLSNVSILLGLILVGVQINQNTELTRLQLRHQGESDYILRHEGEAGVVAEGQMGCRKGAPAEAHR